MTFSIDAGTYTLGKIIRDNKAYKIPVYQRPYSWGEEQISKLLSDIFNAYWGFDRNSEPESMFIGTMQLSEEENEEQDIIDGQQRLTTFLILLKVLKYHYPENEKLKEISFNWLSTTVNDGKQQELLDEFIASSDIKESPDESLSAYAKNATLINKYLVSQIDNEEESPHIFDIDKFRDHLFLNIYFVVIETRAGLSETLKIFDAINTTGLDLGAGDIFKIRMYEYLKKQGKKDNVFGEINKIYALIDERNKEFNKKITDINGILNIYQYILIAEHGLPADLYSYATETFFDRLFETLFNIHKWDHFKNNVEGGKVKLSLNEINDLIEMRYQWERRWIKGDYGTAENASLMNLWWWSRYGRYWDLIFVFLFRHKDDDNKYEKLYEFTNQLVKLYLFYSIYYQKSVNQIKGAFNHKLIKELVTGTFDGAMNIITEKMENIPESWSKENQGNEHREQFKHILEGDVFYSAKLKNILCRLSALLEEAYDTCDKIYILEIRKKLFDDKLDIEHIQSRNHEDETKRLKIREKWGANLNSLGNLVVLEQEINRSISNKSFDEKLKRYSDSGYKIVHKHLVQNNFKENHDWDLDKCRVRKENEARKLMDYILS